MKTFHVTRTLLGTVCAALISTTAMAWTPNGEISRVVSVAQWESSFPVTAFKLENEMWCYIPETTSPENAKLVALITTLYASGKSASFHCHDTAEDQGGISARKLHRVITQ